MLHNTMKVKSVRMSEMMNPKEEAEEDGMVGVAVGEATKGGRRSMLPGSKWRLWKRWRYS
jgi:hypothetical protein